MTCSAFARGVPLMKTAVVFISTVCLLMMPSPTTAASVARMADERPNVVFILAEDMGYGDLGCYGHPYAKTPNLDKLAAEGTKFGRFYVSGVTCNPSRSGFMTSRSPPSFPNYMQDFGFQNATTLTELLHDAGFATGHIGKWHIGPDEEKKDGTYGIDEVDPAGELRRDPRGKDGLVFETSIDFIKRNQDRPFYLNLWGHISHSPVEPHPYLLDKVGNITFNRADFGQYMQPRFDHALELGGNLNEGMRAWMADIWSMDHQIGELMNTLDELGLRENTVIVFTPDHGAAPIEPDKQSSPVNMMGYAGGLRGGKHELYEGGVRVPFIVRWPGHVPAGKVNDWSIMSALDWLPTVCNLTNISIDSAMYEGEDLADVWRGGNRSRANPLYWRFSREQSERAMLYGKWKLFVDAKGVPTLWDLNTDREESVDLYSTNSSARVGKSMEETLEQWEATLPKQWCKLKSGCEDPLPFDPSIPPTKVGPPRDVEFDSGIDVLPTPAPMPDPTPGPVPALTDAPASAPVLVPTGAPVAAPTDVPIPVPTNVPVLPDPGHIVFNGDELELARGNLPLGSLSGSGTVEIIANVAPDGWASSTQAIVGADKTTLQLLSIKSGTFKLIAKRVGMKVVKIKSIKHTFSSGERKWVRAVFNMSTGDVSFYYSDSTATIPQTVADWTQLGSTQQVEAGGTLKPARYLVLGRQKPGGNLPFVGKFYGATFLFDGVELVGVDFTNDENLTSTSPDSSTWDEWELSNLDYVPGTD